MARNMPVVAGSFIFQSMQEIIWLLFGDWLYFIVRFYLVSRFVERSDKVSWWVFFQIIAEV